MQTYTCPTCGEKMERDLSLFMDHTDKHIVAELQKKNPAWVTKEGYCPKCLEWYKGQMSGAGAAGTNLDAGGVLQRSVLGVLGFGAAAGVFVWLRNTGAPKAAWLVLFPCFFMGILGFLQAKRKLCVILAQKQEEMMRRKARVILMITFVASAVLTALCFFIAPASAADDALLAAFPSRDTRDTHDSMASQKKLLAAIQADFLGGDADSAERDINQLARAMQSVGRGIPEEAYDNADTWANLYKIVTETQAMKESADKKDFSKAYDHYSTVVNQCVKCHASGMTVVAPPPEGQPAEAAPAPPADGTASTDSASGTEGHPVFGQQNSQGGTS